MQLQVNPLLICLPGKVDIPIKFVISLGAPLGNSLIKLGGNSNES